MTQTPCSWRHSPAILWGICPASYAPRIKMSSTKSAIVPGSGARRARSVGHVEGRWNYGIWLDLPSAAELRTVLDGLSDRAVAEMKKTEGLRRTISQ